MGYYLLQLMIWQRHENCVLPRDDPKDPRAGLENEVL
jgi:hypothetical protein